MNDKYTVRGFFTSPLKLNGNPLSRLLNGFIEGLNTRDKIPKYVVTVIDDNLVVYANLGDEIVECLQL